MQLNDSWLYRFMLCGLVVIVFAAPVWHMQVNASGMPKTLQDAFMDASEGDVAASEQVINAVENLLIQYPEDPLLTAYYGSAMYLLAEETWLPWNRQKYSKIGLESLNKSLKKLSNESFNKPYYGLNEGLYIQSLAAISFITISESVEQRERGFNMLKSMMASPEFGYYPFEPRAWIHMGAVKAAIDMGDPKMAAEWTYEMRRLAPTHPYTQEALTLLSNYFS